MMTTQDANLALLIMLYSISTHWVPIIAAFDMLVENFYEV
jgi:hypothetical protein